MAAGEAIGCFGLTEPDARLRPGVDAHPRPPRRRRLGARTARKMWITNGSVADVAVVWATRPSDGHPRLRRAHRHRRLHRPDDQAQAVAARLGHLRARPRRRAAAGGRACCPRRAGCKGPLSLPERGPLRHRLGLDRRGPRRAWRRRSTTRRTRDAVRPPDRRVPAHPGQARRHGARAAQGQLLALHLGRLQGRASGCAPSRSASASSTTCGRRSRSAATARTILGGNGIIAGVPGDPAHEQPGVGAAPTRAPPRCTRSSSAQALTGIAAYR